MVTNGHTFTLNQLSSSTQALPAQPATHITRPPHQYHKIRVAYFICRNSFATTFLRDTTGSCSPPSGQSSGLNGNWSHHMLIPRFRPVEYTWWACDGSTHTATSGAPLVHIPLLNWPPAEGPLVLGYTLRDTPTPSLDFDLATLSNTCTSSLLLP